jgi:TldD protein
VASLAGVEGDVESALARLAKHTPFADVLVQDHAGGSARADTSSHNASASPRMRGAVFRAWAGNRWVEGSTSDLAPAALAATVEGLERTLSHATLRGPPPGTPSTTRAERSTKPAKPLADLGPDGMVSLVKDAVGWARSRPSISQVQARVTWGDEHRLYVNSAGARAMQTVSRVSWVFVPIAMENGKGAVDFVSQGGIGGQELLEGVDEQSAVASATQAKAMLTAQTPPAGEMDVILDPSVAGLFAHESFGHGTEADQFLRDRSYLKPLLGSVVGPEFLTIADDGALEHAWGSIYFDDEGHPGQKNRLVDHGRFTGALHDTETAAAYRTRATGNTRRSDFLSRAFVRMTNTYVEPGEQSLDELLAEVKDGVLLEKGTSGIEDPLGGQMQLKVGRGRRIQNGRLTDLLSSMALSGSVLAFLKATRGVGRGDDFSIETGFCGKGHSDYIPVGTGGVHFLSRAVVGPA